MGYLFQENYHAILEVLSMLGAHKRTWNMLRRVMRTESSRALWS